MNSKAPFIIMFLVTIVLGIDVITLTSVLYELLITGGSKPQGTVWFMVTYITHMLEFVGMCYATYKVYEV